MKKFFLHDWYVEGIKNATNQSHCYSLNHHQRLEKSLPNLVTATLVTLWFLMGFKHFMWFRFDDHDPHLFIITSVHNLVRTVLYRLQVIDSKLISLMRTCDSHSMIRSIASAILSFSKHFTCSEMIDSQLHKISSLLRNNLNSSSNTNVRKNSTHSEDLSLCLLLI